MMSNEHNYPVLVTLGQNVGPEKMTHEFLIPVDTNDCKVSVTYTTDTTALDSTTLQNYVKEYFNSQQNKLNFSDKCQELLEIFMLRLETKFIKIKCSLKNNGGITLSVECSFKAPKPKRQKIAEDEQEQEEEEELRL